MRALAGWLLAGCVAGAAVAGGAGMQVSTMHPGQFVFHDDGDRMYVSPGNQGEAWLTENREANPGNLEPWQDVYCDAMWLSLDSPEYKWKINDASTTAPGEYWDRVQGFVSGCRMRGEVPLWKITDDFVDAWRRSPGIMDELTSNVLRYPRLDLLQPTFVVDVTEWDEDVAGLVRRIRQDLPGCLMGGYISEGNVAKVPRHLWDFVVCDDGVVPPGYRGQAALAWARSRFGQVPVVMAPAVPEFQRDVVWLACGAAGLWFQPLPAGDGVDNRHAAIHMRAGSVFFNRFGSEPMQLEPVAADEGINIELTSPGRRMAWVVAGDSQAEVELPGSVAEWRSMAGNWFNPATDENVIEPLQVGRPGRLILRPPSDSLWAYSLSEANSAADTGSTVSAIKELF